MRQKNTKIHSNYSENTSKNRSAISTAIFAAQRVFTSAPGVHPAPLRVFTPAPGVQLGALFSAVRPKLLAVSEVLGMPGCQGGGTDCRPRGWQGAAPAPGPATAPVLGSSSQPPPENLVPGNYPASSSRPGCPRPGNPAAQQPPRSRLPATAPAQQPPPIGKQLPVTSHPDAQVPAAAPGPDAAPAPGPAATSARTLVPARALTRALAQALTRALLNFKHQSHEFKKPRPRSTALEIRI